MIVLQYGYKMSLGTALKKVHTHSELRIKTENTA